ncbi:MULTISPECIES: DUF4123 domain-containing protein [Burkholderia cepacia complex]|uniref:DUF4123 domain-containing protein n=1 Tax=Burkholderia cepacia complex TaxID=87882 RepID=UPI001B9BA44C|nr:DUF4123 domain-containing protein [Burkholderia cenocepacia]MBR8319407.1 DUF4123 domain-containing protein [Burkholderia cenocepacia]
MHIESETIAPMAGAQSCDDLVHTLHKAIVTHGGKCLLVVDPSLRALDDNPIEGVLFSQAKRASVPVEHNAVAPEHWPCLIELDLSSATGAALLAESVRVALADRLPESVARGQGQRIGGWLVVTESLQEVVDHWSDSLLQVDDQGRRCLLRFYDARVLALMWPALTATQRRRLLGPVQTWYALDACAELATYAAPGRSQSDLEIEDAQWTEFHRHAVVNRALALFMNDVERQPVQQEVQTAVDSAGRAEQHGLRDREDKIAFVGHALAWHPSFDAHPAMAAVLEKVSGGDLYCAAASELDPRVVEEIRRGTWFQA